MSLNRENVTWQSKDGTWSLGHYDFYETGSYDNDDYDSEWGVEYTNKLWFVSTGHATADQANRAWRGSNPGGGSQIPYSPETKMEIADLDDEAAQTALAVRNMEQNTSKFRSIQYNQTPQAEGPPKSRKVWLIARDLYAAKAQALSYSIEGYANEPDSRIKQWELTIDKWEKKAPQSLVDLLTKERNTYRVRLEKMAEDLARMLRQSGKSWKVKEALAPVFEEIEKVSTPLIAVETESTPAEVPVTDNKILDQKKFHISPTGRAMECHATKQACPYGGSDKHFPSREAARANYEKKMGAGLGVTSKKR